LKRIGFRDRKSASPIRLLDDRMGSTQVLGRHQAGGRPASARTGWCDAQRGRNNADIRKALRENGNVSDRCTWE
jgi:hypothetical protein